MTKREIVDRIREIDAILASVPAIEEERAMLRELLVEWPDGDDAVDEPPDTEPGTPRTKSSQRMAAVTLPPPKDPKEPEP